MGGKNILTFSQEQSKQRDTHIKLAVCWDATRTRGQMFSNLWTSSHDVLWIPDASKLFKYLLESSDAAVGIWRLLWLFRLLLLTVFCQTLWFGLGFCERKNCDYNMRWFHNWDRSDRTVMWSVWTRWSYIRVSLAHVLSAVCNFVQAEKVSSDSAFMRYREDFPSQLANRREKHLRGRWKGSRLDDLLWLWDYGLCCVGVK